MNEIWVIFLKTLGAREWNSTVRVCEIWWMTFSYSRNATARPSSLLDADHVTMPQMKGILVLFHMIYDYRLLCSHGLQSDKPIWGGMLADPRTGAMQWQKAKRFWFDVKTRVASGLRVLLGCLLESPNSPRRTRMREYLPVASGPWFFLPESTLCRVISL